MNRSGLKMKLPSGARYEKGNPHATIIGSDASVRKR